MDLPTRATPVLRVQFEAEYLEVRVLLARKQEGVKVGEVLTDQVLIWPQVEDSGRVIGFGQLVEEAIREAVELAEEREAGG